MGEMWQEDKVNTYKGTDPIVIWRHDKERVKAGDEQVWTDNVMLKPLGR